jgi:DNA-binding Lrp family transcriptional regulator
MVRGYVFVHTDLLRANDVVKAARECPNVLFAESVSGPYDVIVQLEASGRSDLRRITTDEIATIAGVTRAILCPVEIHEHLWEEVLEPAYTGRSGLWWACFDRAA